MVINNPSKYRINAPIKQQAKGADHSSNIRSLSRHAPLRPRSRGVEALVAREPLRQVHERQFAVLALESEPIDPKAWTVCVLNESFPWNFKRYAARKIPSFDRPSSDGLFKSVDKTLCKIPSAAPSNGLASSGLMNSRSMENE